MVRVFEDFLPDTWKREVEGVQFTAEAVVEWGKHVELMGNVEQGYWRSRNLQYGEFSNLIRTKKWFLNAMELARSYTAPSLLSDARLMNLCLIIRRFLSQSYDKNIVEFGSYKMGTVLFMAKLLEEIDPKARVFALDTFSGIPESSCELDYHNAGEFSGVDLQGIRSFMNDRKVENVQIVEGDFRETFDWVLSQAGSIGMVHIDCDTYRSTKFAIESAQRSLAEGGYIVVDDVNGASCLGVARAVEEMVVDYRSFAEQTWPHFVFRKGKACVNHCQENI